MLITTTFDVPGFRITEQLGIVRGITVRAPTLQQGFFGGLKSIVGGKIGAYVEMCEQARVDAYNHLVQHATEVGADAVVGFRYDGSDIGGQGRATEVLCYGTAVKLARTTS